MAGGGVGRKNLALKKWGSDSKWLIQKRWQWMKMKTVLLYFECWMPPKESCWTIGDDQLIGSEVQWKGCLVREEAYEGDSLTLFVSWWQYGEQPLLKDVSIFKDYAASGLKQHSQVTVGWNLWKWQTQEVYSFFSCLSSIFCYIEIKLIKINIHS